ncbi:hypothetical protein LSAT2_024644 [Lamellibrachia satsuma]|nr:hypothetical protein LSAT2_024644 [Lamellibrachia satsuma]
MAEFSNVERCDPAPGRHCNSTIPRLYGFICNVTQERSNYYNISDKTNSTALIHCVDCFFPNHCLDNNTCLWGTAGPTCERCLRKGEQGNEKAFYPLGSLCVECSTVPWSAIIFLALCIASLIAIFRLGFSVSLYVKLKLLCNYLQLVLLTLNVRILWPGIYLTVLKFFASANFITEFVSPECLFSPLINLHYLKWLMILIIPILAFTLSVFLQRSMTKLIKGAVVEDKKLILLSTRQQWQRFSVFLFLSCYSPLLHTSLQGKACSKNMYKNLVLDEKDVFMYDQGTDISCDQLAFQFFTSVCSIYLLLGLCMPLVVLFFTLRQKKWHLLTTMIDNYGSFYEPYTAKFCFWETLLLLRMMLMVFLTEVYLFSPRMQIVLIIGLTCAYLSAVCACGPYRKVAWICSPAICVHTTFEVTTVVPPGEHRLLQSAIN